MRKALLAATTFILVGFMLVDGTLAGVLNEVQGIFQNLTDVLGQYGTPARDSAFDVDLAAIGETGQFFPGGEATHTVAVRNVCDLDACFRVAVALQYDAETWPMLHTTFTYDDAYFAQEGSWRDITVGGTPYKMMVFTYRHTLLARTSSPTIAVTIAMDKEVTSAQISRFRSDFLQMQVMAIEADAFLTSKDPKTPPPFASPAEALEAALPLDTLNPFR